MSSELPPLKSEAGKTEEHGFAFSPKEGTGTGSRAPKKDTAPDAIGVNDSRFDSFDGVPVLKSATQEDIENREQRLSCSFPGLMKILIPEKSFVPTSLAVRVANLSVNGAMIEVHDTKHLGDDIALANRFFELKIAHPEIPILRGTIAWSDVGREKPLLGLSCFDRLPQFEDVVLSNEASRAVKGPPPLPAPELEPFPPVTSDRHLTLVGRAKEALEIVVRGSTDKFTAPVVDGKFRIKLELAEVGENHFSVRSMAGTRKSRAVPVRVIHNAPVAPNAPVKRRQGNHFDVSIATLESGAESVTLEFTGNVKQAERVLFRFSQLMSSCDTVSFDTTIAAQVIDKNLYKALKGEGVMLLNDTNRSNQAAELLDELL